MITSGVEIIIYFTIIDILVGMNIETTPSTSVLIVVVWQFSSRATIVVADLLFVAKIHR